MIVQGRHHGFTLIEILVAVAILAIIAVASSTVLSSVIDSAKASDTQMQELEMLQRSMMVIERDMSQIIALAPRLSGQDNEVVIQGGNGVADSLADGILFTRNGWANPLQRQPRSNLQGVGYRLNGSNELERIYTFFIDNVTNTEPQTRMLLPNVSNLIFEFAIGTNNRNEIQWEEQFTGKQLPRGIAIVITSETFGEIRREFAILPQGVSS
ncbi:type II secretion system minor pseudopilin GspJ [Alteromonas sp. LMIT006]|uniref:type II secretion system minor pseudopilin GspJ n=1 Tax=Alteromonadaceae TaxID=72275 RepID=UPI0019EA3289|nr:type II secretion system minor pseudopilin GspJ [Alteromonas sp. LMIT006]MBE1286331.1 type II secretion system protein GspJ [Alteromonadaceae bacterium]UTP73107.1 type II secretion system minor pseudopilin GspJ [Alteromonas sp. LMIT006]